MRLFRIDLVETGLVDTLHHSFPLAASVTWLLNLPKYWIHMLAAPAATPAGIVTLIWYSPG